MKNSHFKLSLLVASIISVSSFSTNANLVCPEGSNNCSVVSPNLGDTTQSADNSTSKVDQNNNSSAANPSNTTISPVIKNATNNDGSVTGGNVTGGNTSSQGGSSSAIGNKNDSRNDNNSSASTGASTSSNGSNSNGSNSNGDQSFHGGTTSNTTGPSNASNGNQSLTGGATSNSNGQGQGQSSSNLNGQSSVNDLVNKNNTSNEVANSVGQGQSSSNNNKVQGSNQGQSSNNDVANSVGQSSANSNKVDGSSQGQSSTNDLSTSDNRTQSASNANGDVNGSQSLENAGNAQSSNSMDKSGNSNTRVDASDRSISTYNSLALARAPIVHGGVISLPSPTMNTVVGQCGPIPSLLTQPVMGTHIGVFKNKAIPLGFTQQIGMNYTSAPFTYSTAPDGSLYEYGVQSVITVSVNNMGSSRSMSANLSSSIGKDAGGGAQNSSSMQGQVTTVQLVPCVHSIYAPKPQVIPVIDEPKPDMTYLEHGMKG